MSHHSEQHSHGDDAHEAHVVPDKVFHVVFVLLLVGTFVTFAVTWVDFGLAINVIVALLVASLKALLVVLFFMHLKYEQPDIIKYAIFPIVLLFIFFGGIFLDAPTRGYDDRFSIDSKKVDAGESHGSAEHH